MSLVQLIYVSTASKVLTLEDLKSIVEVAKLNNQKHMISGFLCSDKRYFNISKQTIATRP
ncbi:hypothetical protein A3752_25775 [Oleiphilus sp. HI0081]|nr:hypothetical protein A3729_27700 [Oleiphilus sp. HI0043]KZY41122.1 hypothetical protein A3732_03210 [Oleiphilus sp. HI0050]KZY58876.1 hypothetical protein A3735_16830 [Oleiphilus sp. HI0061]KZY75798.1 hypothetical protein A3741_11635 [Oleiphilus sp. HI0069]KZY78763.1 hypothetical protein A3740_07400 [Oleiphilus sp. HI0068]KZY88938.1 hypothetical protein A3743_09950 [Oleiphilus sp. HI0072]KZZ09869.1 hypothetical protein A3749_01605 [Oleiphilus sp. HI0078]KZZ22241.1 hypothetical protein A37